MRGGRLDRRLTLWKRERVRDPKSGELVDGWTRMGDLWARSMPASVLERHASQQKLAEVSQGYEMRWAPALITLTPDEHRVSYGHLVYDIVGVMEIGRREGVSAFCRARAEGLTAQGLMPLEA